MNNKHVAATLAWKLACSFGILAGAFLLAMLFGAKETTLHDLWQALTWQASQKNEVMVLRELRLPREIGALLIGAAFAVSGAIMQGVTRNPLADPGLLGLTAGANMALAAAFAFIPGISYTGIMAACFVGAALGAGLVLIMSSARRGGLSPFRVVLAGAAVSAFLYAIASGISLVFKISKDVSMWTAGGLIGTSWEQVAPIAPVIVVAIVIALLLSNQLNILSLSEEVAIGLGQKQGRIKLVMFLLVIVMTGAAVALVGNMAFVGLMIPHMIRRFTGTDYRILLPVSAVAGGTFMMLADTLGRTINSPYETPVAAIVAMIGLPFFLFVVHKGGKTLS
ncbi:FecCD family ABC transporter permease [Paenibacillus sp. NPDC058071]|uniref:FecCD family ABC transporter permease n=1 Tax=Paenibacillus sp. NPDC058071 TaxID=3346326 RepID=UPI0036D76FA5